ncbi:hypothetical protein [Deinococcus yavapaiensis]|uniref:Treble-clef zinc-finger protein n=1 Tax=Deinococcus yavapaiensis KR-236 TaxID=694435 RepID=A0A318S6G6_9DEIO|nr:hypothetical protein [Deinococcus yavapaiensis]PYE54483.1 hypothetical protein DES52_105121 [Deinococcus yavapaiensis KR-236]
MNSHSERDLLLELFPETARREFGEGGTKKATLGLFPVGDGKLALVRGGRLVELHPVDAVGKNACHCDLCHTTRSRGDVGIYRVEAGVRRYRYVTLCLSTRHCQDRGGHTSLAQLADRLLSEA